MKSLFSNTPIARSMMTAERSDRGSSSPSRDGARRFSGLRKAMAPASFFGSAGLCSIVRLGSLPAALRDTPKSAGVASAMAQPSRVNEARLMLRRGSIEGGGARMHRHSRHNFP